MRSNQLVAAVMALPVFVTVQLKLAASPLRCNAGAVKLLTTRFGAVRSTAVPCTLAALLFSLVSLIDDAPAVFWSANTVTRIVPTATVPSGSRSVKLRLCEPPTSSGLAGL